MKEPYTFFGKTHMPFSAPQFLSWLMAPALRRRLPMALQNGVRGRGQQPHESRRARSAALADMSSDESGRRVAIPDQAQASKKAVKKSIQHVWVRMTTLCPPIYLHSCDVAQAGTRLKLRETSRSSISKGINSGKTVHFSLQRLKKKKNLT